jgi:hypothetical protein
MTSAHGQRFDRWLIVGLAPPIRFKNGSSQSALICRCECGVYRVVAVQRLKEKRSRSCGCIQSGTPVEERFDRLTKRGGDGECWTWIGSKNAEGYGMFRVPGRKKIEKAHRFALELKAQSPLPGGAVVCHRCDNPSCVNPDHLFIGTHADNSRDRDKKGRARNPRQKLNEATVREIRAGGLPRSVVATRYGISHKHAARVLGGTVWRGV